MPWKETTVLTQRREFVSLALLEGANLSELCLRFGISRKSAYKWIRRFRELGVEGLVNHSRRPHTSPGRSSGEVEQQVLKLRSKHPTWGGRKLRCRLRDLGHAAVPAASTITQILRRHGQLDPQRADQPRDWQRFEHAAPNDLWQMDFKGHFSLTRDGRCHPLTVLDDHSRYALGLRACGDECGITVQAELTQIFQQYGLPRRMTMDNGPPWGFEDGQVWTRFTAWLIRLGVRVTHGRPYHPQTQGKDERFHRTLKLELLSQRSFSSLRDCQQAFDPWRLTYNTERPHEALGMATPVSRYRPSGRSFPNVLPPIEYASDVQVRKVGDGAISFQGREIRVGKAFNDQPVGVRGVDEGIYEVLYCHQPVGRFDLRSSVRGSHSTLSVTDSPR